MNCRYCGKPLSLLKELSDGEFCSRDHRLKYKSLTKRALDRLQETDRSSSAPPQRVSPIYAGFISLRVAHADDVSCRLPASSAPAPQAYTGHPLKPHMQVRKRSLRPPLAHFRSSVQITARPPAAARVITGVEPLVIVRGVKLATGASARLGTIDLPLEARSRTISH